ncbi:MAG: D-amino acid aminotransferase [Gemmatimonadota bacterium]
MPEIAYVNGSFMPLADAVVSVEDRGFQFADGVYEVIATYGGAPYAMEAHLMRLERSLRELQIDLDVRGGDIDLAALVGEGMARAGFAETLVYIQVTRGTAPRHHEFPVPRARPTVVMTLKALRRPPAESYRQGVRVITAPDLRWKRCDIKSVALLPNILAKEEAHRAGAFEALLLDGDGCVTEGSSTSAFCVRGGGVYTAPASPAILPSITRGVLIDLARQIGVPVTETAVTRQEYLDADEVFLAGTTTEAMPVVEIDGHRIGDGQPGPVTRRLREAFLKTL